MAGPEHEEIVVTGVGVVAPAGIGQEAFWEGSMESPGHVDPQYTVPDFDAAEHLANNPPSGKELRRLDRFSIFALVAAEEAVQQAGLHDDVNPRWLGVSFGTGDGGTGTKEQTIMSRAPHPEGEKRINPFYIPTVMPNAAAAHVSIRHGAQGPTETVSTACATGTHSVIKAMRFITNGEADVVIAGSSEATRDAPNATEGFRNSTALSSEGVSRPFTAERDGFVLGEGAGALVLERRTHAEKRGATILATLKGHGSTADAHHITQPDPSNTGIRNAVLLATVGSDRLRELEAQDEDILGAAEPDLEVIKAELDVIRAINAHGTSTPLNDKAEAEVYAQLFGTGPDSPLITSNKGQNGHPLGGCAIEIVSCVLSIQRSLVPPIGNHDKQDPELPNLNFVHGKPAPWTPGDILKNSLAFGGHNAALRIGPPAS